MTRLCKDLDSHLIVGNYDLVERLITSLADLGNAHVVSLESISDLLHFLLDNSKAQNVSEAAVYIRSLALLLIGLFAAS